MAITPTVWHECGLKIEALVSPRTLSEMGLPGPTPELLNPKLHFSMIPRWSMCLWKSEELAKHPCDCPDPSTHLKLSSPSFIIYPLFLLITIYNAFTCLSSVQARMQALWGQRPQVALFFVLFGI